MGPFLAFFTIFTFSSRRSTAKARSHRPPKNLDLEERHSIDAKTLHRFIMVLSKANWKVGVLSRVTNSHSEGAGESHPVAKFRGRYFAILAVGCTVAETEFDQGGFSYEALLGSNSMFGDRHFAAGPRSRKERADVSQSRAREAALRS